MSFSLSNLLNPAPAGDSSDNSSIPPLQIPHDAVEAGQAEAHHVAQPGTQEAAHVLASLSASTVPPPTSWQSYNVEQSSSTTYDGFQPPSEVRRPSHYNESSGPFELPRPKEVQGSMHSPSLEQYRTNSRSPETARRASTYGDSGVTSHSGSLARTMSSPSLEQYQVASRSPEQRRTSTIDTHNSAFTLAPLQSSFTGNSKHEEQEHWSESHGHDSSHLLAGIEQYTQPQLAEQSSVTTDVQREPSYTRDEPSAVQIRSASEAQGADNAELRSLAENHRGSPAPVKLEKASTLPDSIPAFVPVPPVKREQSSQAHSPLRENSVPVPTTEDMATPEVKGKKRPAPRPTKKGTAKKGGPPSKKRKTEHNSDGSKSKAARSSGNLLGKKTTSASATPLNPSPAPRSTRSGRSSVSPEVQGNYSEGEEDDEEPGTPGSDDELYCICRRPDTGTFMIGCDGGCDDWFHGKCVGIAEKDKTLIDRYMCPNCERKGLGVTTWKRMCRRPGCRLPARLAKKKGEPTSKYCSEECGMTFFKDIISRKTRFATEAPLGKKGNRNKSTVTGEYAADDDIAGSRGSALSAGEVKSLVTSVPGIDEFKRLGDGVLSPPATPPPKDSKVTVADESIRAAEGALNDVEAERMTKILFLKDQYRTRHALLKDRIKFITMVKQAATNIAEEKGMKPKEMCGYDDRVSWTEERFAAWRDTPAGSKSLQSGIIERTTVVKDAQGDSKMEDESQEVDTEVCSKRKCARHYDWAKLSLDEARFEIGENSEQMRGLEREEKDIRERSALRARELKAGDVGGHVELHEAPTYDGEITNTTTSDQMDLDPKVPTPMEDTATLGASDLVKNEPEQASLEPYEATQEHAIGQPADVPMATT